MTKSALNKTVALTCASVALFPNLSALLLAEAEKDVAEFKASLDEHTDPWKLIAEWRIKELITPGKRNMIWEIGELKTYLIQRYAKQAQKRLDEQLAKLQRVADGPDLISAKISVEWRRNRTWGHNPVAGADIRTAQGWEGEFSSGSIGGCGYDKHSTAVAGALNASRAFLKVLYLHKEKNPSVKNHDLFGYGSGYGILPRLEGGVGISCYPAIMETVGFTFRTVASTVGFTFRTVASGKSFDVHEIAKATV
jgi:hypothetical protein